MSCGHFVEIALADLTISQFETMIKFFRHIRKSLLMENKTSKYFKYAIGEILLVVIGILIALQINNWNEHRKERQVEVKAYNDLLSTLKKDAAELSYILEVQRGSSVMQQQMISADFNDIQNIQSSDSLNKIIFQIMDGARSFFPKYGTYNSIVSNKGIDIISSEEIKSKLIDLYDYQCSRYQFVDKAIDEKYMNDFYPFVQKELGFYLNTDGTMQEINIEQFQDKFNAFQLECKNLGPMTRNTLELLEKINESVHSLIENIDAELNN